MHTHFQTLFLSLLTVCLGLSSAEAELIASESFHTTRDGASGSYSTDAKGFGSDYNSFVTAGTHGFSATRPWQNNTLLIRPLPNSIEHPAVPGESFDGAVLLNPGADARALMRNVVRPIDAKIPRSNTYYLSMIIRPGAGLALEDGEYAAVGFGGYLVHTTSSVQSGFHLGLFSYDGTMYLAAMAGGDVHRICEVEATNDVYYVLLKLEPKEGGKDLLSAAWAPEDETRLKNAFERVEVETYSDRADLEYLALQVNMVEKAESERSFATRFDEVRFGTELEDVYQK